MLTSAELKKIRELILNKTGIALGDDKDSFVDAKFHKFRQSKNNLSIEKAYSLVLEDEQTFQEFLDHITINHTFFFRESAHFVDLVERVKAKKGKRVKIWSAACSTGPEPYTIAMVLEDIKADYKILASDIDGKALKIAKEGRYPLDMLNQIPKQYHKYLEVRSNYFDIKPILKSRITFVNINLIDIPANLKPEFDFIFCRNVFIYFNNHQKINCLENFKNLLLPGGIIYLGLSEFISVTIPGLMFISKSTYLKSGT